MRIIIVLIASFYLLVSFFTSAQAIFPAGNHLFRYIQSNGSYAYYSSNKETYIKNTLPNEWIASWPSETLKAGAVIIRSGVYWRQNRSLLGSLWPNNNCYQTGSGGTISYVTVPNSRGGYEEWLPNSMQSSTNAATNNTAFYHPERVSLPSGRPDKLVGLRYNSTIQNRTNSGSGGWIAKIRYAYLNLGSPYDPNVQCSQIDDQTSSDPLYTNQ